MCELKLLAKTTRKLQLTSTFPVFLLSSISLNHYVLWLQSFVPQLVTGTHTSSHVECISGIIDAGRLPPTQFTRAITKQARDRPRTMRFECFFRYFKVPPWSDALSKYPNRLRANVTSYSKRRPRHSSEQNTKGCCKGRQKTVNSFFILLFV